MKHNLFNTHRLYALFLIIIASILGWFSIVLLTDDPSTRIYIDSSQWWGLAFTICISIFIWVEQCFTIKPYISSA